MSILKPGNVLASYSENSTKMPSPAPYSNCTNPSSGPHMEYCSPVWDPHLTKDTMLLENAKKFGLRVCLKDWSSSYEELLCKANLPPPPHLSAVHWQECVTCIKLFMILLTFLKCLWKDGSSTTAVEPTILLGYLLYCTTATQHNSSTLTFQELLLIGTRYQQMW